MKYLCLWFIDPCLTLQVESFSPSLQNFNMLCTVLLGWHQPLPIKPGLSLPCNTGPHVFWKPPRIYFLTINMGGFPFQGRAQTHFPQSMQSVACLGKCRGEQSWRVPLPQLLPCHSPTCSESHFLPSRSRWTSRQRSLCSGHTALSMATAAVTRNSVFL